MVIEFENMSMNVAQAGGLVPMLDQHSVISIELPIQTGPQEWMKDNGFVGALINVPLNERPNLVSETPFVPTRMVPITILRPAEIEFCAQGGAARETMADDLVRNASGHITDFTRSSLR